MITPLEQIGQRIRNRRQELGISEAALSARAGVSVTAVRNAQAHPGRAQFETIHRLADVLGLTTEGESKLTPQAVRRRAAEQKARWLARQAQGNSALEKQGVDEELLADLIDQTAAELLAGSPRRLWD